MLQARLSLSSRPQPPRDSDTSREDFLRDVDTVKEHIQAGDVFQLVLSQRFRRRTFADPFEIYRRALLTPERSTGLHLLPVVSYVPC